MPLVPPPVLPCGGVPCHPALPPNHFNGAAVQRLKPYSCFHAPLQGLPAKIGSSRATAAASGKPLHFPELAFLETHPTHEASISVGVLWCKATMLASFYGHVTPHRPSWLVSLTHPDHLSGRCGAAQCRQQGCSGNRLERAADGNYTLVVPHHKTSTTSSGPTIITYPLPPSMFIWMDVWLLWCWPMFAKQASANHLQWRRRRWRRGCLCS